MGALVAYGRAAFARDVTPARSYVEFELDETVTTADVPCALDSQRRGIVVELKPRTFAQTASHLRSVTKKFDWPVSAPDID